LFLQEQLKGIIISEQLQVADAQVTEGLEAGVFEDDEVQCVVALVLVCAQIMMPHQLGTWMTICSHLAGNVLLMMS